jgi:hypothetical protein
MVYIEQKNNFSGEEWDIYLQEWLASRLCHFTLREIFLLQLNKEFFSDTGPV